MFFEINHKTLDYKYKFKTLFQRITKNNGRYYLFAELYYTITILNCLFTCHG